MYRLVLCVRVLVNACVRRYEAVGVVSACVGVFSCVCPRYLWSVDVCVAGPVLMSAGAGVSPRVVAQVQRFLTALRARGESSALWAVTSALFLQYWSRNKDIADAAVIREAASEVGAVQSSLCCCWWSSAINTVSPGAHGWGITAFRYCFK